MAKKRAIGEGTIYQRKDGRWESAAYFLTTSGERKRIRVYAKTRQEAREKLMEAQAQASRGIPVPDKTWRLGDYLDQWLESVVRQHRRPATYKQCEAVVRLYIKPRLGRHPVTGLSVATVQASLDQLLAAGRSPATIHTVRKVLSAALTNAMRQELIFSERCSTRSDARLRGG